MLHCYLHYLCSKSKNKLHFGIKNEQVHFILLSVCIIFAVNKKKHEVFRTKTERTSA